MPTLPADEAWERVAASRVAYLSTVTEDGRPHLVPIVFAIGENRTIYSFVDPKPKTGLDAPPPEHRGQSGGVGPG